MKKVSYIQLLKEAINEYDAKQMDKLGPMTEPILTFKGDGELLTHKDASSVLERYYFNETKETLVEQDEDAQSEASKKAGSGPEGDAVDPNEIVTGEEADAVPTTMDDLEDEILDEDFDLDEDLELEDATEADLVANEKPLDPDSKKEDIVGAEEKPLDIKEDVDLSEELSLEEFDLDEEFAISEGPAGATAGGTAGGMGGYALGKKFGSGGAKVAGAPGAVAGAVGGAILGSTIGHMAQSKTKELKYRPESVSLENAVINKLIQEMESEDDDGKSEASKNASKERADGGEAGTDLGKEPEIDKLVEDFELDEDFDLEEDIDLEGIEEDVELEDADLEEDVDLEGIEEDVDLEGIEEDVDLEGIEEDVELEDADLEEDIDLEGIEEDVELEDFDLTEAEAEAGEEGEGEGEEGEAGEEGGEKKSKKLDVDKEIATEGEGMGPIRVKAARELEESFRIFKEDVE